MRRAEARRVYPANITCEQCGATVPRSASRDGQRFCSNACRLEGLNAAPRPVRQAPCRICGKLFRCPPGFQQPDADGSTRGLYCSRACMWSDDDYRKRRAAKHSPTQLERWLFRVLDEAAVPYEKFATVGRYVPDALLPEYMTIIEVDGAIWHRKRIEYDRRRDADLAAAGYVVMHFTDLELTSLKKSRQLIGGAVADIKGGRQKYRAPLL